jgi:hypothetical protein
MRTDAAFASAPTSGCISIMLMATRQTPLMTILRFFASKIMIAITGLWRIR